MELIHHSDPRIIHVNFPTQYAVCSTFMRLQEFYESPFDNIRGKYFTLEEYMDTYAAVNGNFTYTSDWSGFNVPGDVIRDFAKLYNVKVISKEFDLLAECGEYLFQDDPAWDKKFYLIGTYGDDNKGTVNHELAHAYYHIDPDYKQIADTIYEGMNGKVKATVREWLLKTGYCEEVVVDETQAYFATDTLPELRKRFGLVTGELSSHLKFKANFQNKTLGPQ